MMTTAAANQLGQLSQLGQLGVGPSFSAAGLSHPTAATSPLCPSTPLTYLQQQQPQLLQLLPSTPGLLTPYEVRSLSFSVWLSFHLSSHIACCLFSHLPACSHNLFSPLACGQQIKFVFVRSSAAVRRVKWEASIAPRTAANSAAHFLTSPHSDTVYNLFHSQALNNQFTFHRSASIIINSNGDAPPNCACAPLGSIWICPSPFSSSTISLFHAPVSHCNSQFLLCSACPLNNMIIFNRTTFRKYTSV